MFQSYWIFFTRYHSAKQLTSIHNYNAIIENKFEQQKKETSRVDFDPKQATTMGKPPNSFTSYASSCERYFGSQSQGNITVGQSCSEIPDDRSEHIHHGLYSKRAWSLDDKGSDQSYYWSSFLNAYTNETLEKENVSLKFQSHSDGLMLSSKQRQFDFSPNSAPYSLISSLSGNL